MTTGVAADLFFATLPSCLFGLCDDGEQPGAEFQVDQRQSPGAVKDFANQPRSRITVKIEYLETFACNTLTVQANPFMRYFDIFLPKRALQKEVGDACVLKQCDNVLSKDHLSPFGFCLIV